MSSIDSFIRTCRELDRLCSMDGIIDSATLEYEIVMETSTEAVVEVRFDELAMAGRNRVPCSGQLHLYKDKLGRIIRADIL